MSLLTVGSVAFDALETPFGKTDKIIGGAATYITLAASYFTKENNLVAVVGGDFPDEMISLLQDHGVNTEGLEIVKEGKTFFWSGKYHEDMNTRDTLVTELNVMEHFDPIIPESFQGTTFLMLGNTVPATQKLIIERMTSRPKLIMLDTMNLWMNIAMDDLKAVLKMVDLITINDEEARQLSGEYSLRKAAKKIMEMGPKTLIIKKGEHGALLFGKNSFFAAPAFPLEDVYDPTGAGDTFAGGFFGFIARQDGDTSDSSLRRAVVYGSVMASFTVEKFSLDRLKTLTQEHIDARVRMLRELAQFEAG